MPFTSPTATRRVWSCSAGFAGHGGDNLLIGGEVRYQSGRRELPLEVGFVGDRIDLGGFTYQAVFQVRF